MKYKFCLITDNEFEGIDTLMSKDKYEYTFGDTTRKNFRIPLLFDTVDNAVQFIKNPDLSMIDNKYNRWNKSEIEFCLIRVVLEDELGRYGIV